MVALVSSFAPMESGDNVVAGITSPDGIRFELSNTHIYIHLRDESLLILSILTSHGRPYFEIPFREDLDILVALIQKGWFARREEGIYIDTVLKTKGGKEYVCYLPYG